MVANKVGDIAEPEAPPAQPRGSEPTRGVPAEPKWVGWAQAGPKWVGPSQVGGSKPGPSKNLGPNKINYPREISQPGCGIGLLTLAIN